MLRFHSSTEKFIIDFKNNTPQAQLLSGAKGIGLHTLAQHLVQQSGTLLTTVSPIRKTTASLPSIGVEQVRQLYEQTKTRLDGPHFIIIDDADAMNPMAQNALLKLLEEPNDTIHFLLTTHSVEKLLPTIRSRLQHFAVPPISQLASSKLLASKAVTDELTLRRLLFIASGLPAQLSRMADSASDFKTLSDRAATARAFVEGARYQRMVLISSLKDDRAGAVELIDLILFLLRKSLSSSNQRSTITLIDALVNANEVIRANGNIRLQLLRAITQ